MLSVPVANLAGMSINRDSKNQNRSRFLSLTTLYILILSVPMVPRLFNKPAVAPTATIGSLATPPRTTRLDHLLIGGRQLMARFVLANVRLRPVLDLSSKTISKTTLVTLPICLPLASLASCLVLVTLYLLASLTSSLTSSTGLLTPI
jgi:hypothetical protein